MAELKDGDRVEHKNGGLATVTRAECNDAGNPNCAMVLFDSGKYPEPMSALKCNLIPLGQSDSRRFVIVKSRGAKRPETQPTHGPEPVSLRAYDLPTARDAQRRAVLLREMGRAVKDKT